MMLTRFARPKVNLFLHVIGKREDGYHLLESLVCFPKSGGDKLWVDPAANLLLTGSGPYSETMGEPADNLVLKAAKLLQDEFGVSKGAHIHLEKNLPVASGIGGGSSDAAAAMHLLNEFWQIGASLDTLAQLGARLGADIPVCLHAETAMMEGVGEKVTPVGGLPAVFILLVNPGVSVATPTVFKALKGIGGNRRVRGYNDLSSEIFIESLQSCANDLEAGAIGLVPEIADVLQALKGCKETELVRMSGSGATCFALFKTEAAANAASKKINKGHPKWWTLVSGI